MPEGAFFGFLRLAAIPAVSREPERKRALDDLSAVIDGGVGSAGVEVPPPPPVPRDGATTTMVRVSVAAFLPHRAP